MVEVFGLVELVEEVDIVDVVDVMDVVEVSEVEEVGEDVGVVVWGVDPVGLGSNSGEGAGSQPDDPRRARRVKAERDG